MTFTYIFFILMQYVAYIYNYIKKLWDTIFPKYPLEDPLEKNMSCFCRLLNFPPKTFTDYIQIYFYNKESCNNKQNYVIRDIKYIDSYFIANGTFIYHPNENQYIVRKDIKDNSIITSIITSAPEIKKPFHKIMFADYTHPELDDPINFEHILNYCYIGNDLFTPEFIYRYLLYRCYKDEPIPGQKGGIPFDNNYQIIAMDEMANIYYIKPTQYLHIGEKEIQTITVKT